MIAIWLANFLITTVIVAPNEASIRLSPADANRFANESLESLHSLTGLIQLSKELAVQASNQKLADDQRVLLNEKWKENKQKVAELTTQSHFTDATDTPYFYWQDGFDFQIPVTSKFDHSIYHREFKFKSLSLEKLGILISAFYPLYPHMEYKENPSLELNDISISAPITQSADEIIKKINLRFHQTHVFADLVNSPLPSTVRLRSPTPFTVRLENYSVFGSDRYFDETRTGLSLEKIELTSAKAAYDSLLQFDSALEDLQFNAQSLDELLRY